MLMFASFCVVLELLFSFCVRGHQYKGRFDLFDLSRAHLKVPGIEQWHDFPATSHFAGPHDGIGKTPTTMMEREETFENERVYDYHHCLQFCYKYLSKPSSESDHKGTWGCNGTHSIDSIYLLCCLLIQESTFGTRFQMETTSTATGMFIASFHRGTCIQYLGV